MTITEPPRQAGRQNDADPWMSIDQLIDKYLFSEERDPNQDEESIAFATLAISLITMGAPADCCCGGSRQLRRGSKRRDRTAYFARAGPPPPPKR